MTDVEGQGVEQSAYPTSTSAEGGDDQSDNKKTRLYKRLTINEWLTLLVAVASLFVSVRSCQISADTSDTKDAIGHLSDLANASQAESNAMSNEVAVQAQQLSLLGQQVGETKKQTQALSDQATSLKASTAAAMQLNQLQRNAATANLSTQLPSLSLESLTLTGIEAPPDNDGKVSLTMRYVFRNVGGTRLIDKDVEWNLQTATDLPEIMPSLNISNGNDLDIGNGMSDGLTTTEDLKPTFDYRALHNVRANIWKMFFFGKINYDDVFGVHHTKCFGYLLTIKDGQSTAFTKAGGAAYHCAT